MTLHVHDDAEGRNVWVTGVPSDYSDADVQACFAEASDAGDAVALRALSLVRYWVRMNRDTDGTRVYLDG